MRVLVLGGGVIGVTTAWFLSQAGHEVEIVERRGGPALETSFANAGEISPGYSSPMGRSRRAAQSGQVAADAARPARPAPESRPGDVGMAGEDAPHLHVRALARNKARMVPLAEHSRDLLRQIRAESGIRYDERSSGTLQLFRMQKQLHGIIGDIAVLDQIGVPFEVLGPDGCMAAEPALRYAAGNFFGGLRLPGDETGDCQKFTEQLAALCAERGVRFRFDTDIWSIRK